MNRLIIILTLIVLTSCGKSKKVDNSENRTETKASILTKKVDSVKIETKNRKFEKPTKIECVNYEFNTTKEQSDSLLAFMEKATSLDSTSRQNWERKFFCTFPSSFRRMQALFGYDNDKGAAPLYDYPKGENVIKYFSQLNSISDSIYYNKYIKINIDGIWEADNISEAFDFASRLITDTKNSCQALSKFSDKDIKSVFRFIFDGPHPMNDYNENLYKKLKSIIDEQNKRLGQLLAQAYDNLIAEDDGHGH